MVCSVLRQSQVHVFR